MAEWVGFEPTDAFTSLVFKTSTINHSDITPLFMNIIALFHSAVNTLEQIFRIELKIKLYKSLVIPLTISANLRFSWLIFVNVSLHEISDKTGAVFTINMSSFDKCCSHFTINPDVYIFILLQVYQSPYMFCFLLYLFFLMWSFPVVVIL